MITVLVTCTLQFNVQVESNCSRNEAIQTARDLLEDSLAVWPNDLLTPSISDVKVENLSSDDGRFNK